MTLFEKLPADDAGKLEHLFHLAQMFKNGDDDSGDNDEGDNAFLQALAASAAEEDEDDRDDYTKGQDAVAALGLGVAAPPPFHEEFEDTEVWPAGCGAAACRARLALLHASSSNLALQNAVFLSHPTSFLDEAMLTRRLGSELALDTHDVLDWWRDGDRCKVRLRTHGAPYDALHAARLPQRRAAAAAPPPRRHPRRRRRRGLDHSGGCGYN